MHRSSRIAVLTLAVLVCASPSHVSAQWQSNTGPGGAMLGAVVGGDVERYLRAMAMAGLVRPLPWAVRPFGPADLARFLADSSSGPDPWRARMVRAVTSRSGVGAQAFASANSGFAWGSNDGAMWQGRGVNVSAGLAATARWGVFSAVAAPRAVASQNASVPLLLASPRGVTADPLFYNNVDLPLRMGTKAYARADPGESTVRMAVGGVVAGITTASLGWGTSESFPAIFGANAGGFSHVFAGTQGGGVRLPGVGHLSARYVLGVLEQTRWSPVQGSETYVDAAQPGTRRLGTGLVVSFMPAVLPGLELGANRFYHSPFLAGPARWQAWSRPFEGIFKKGLPPRDGPAGEQNGDLDNQMASFFARFVMPRRGVEAALEIFREDYNWDARDLAQEPENNSAVIATFRALTERSANALSVLAFEYFDGNVRPIAQARGQGALYVHGTLRQGHTERGQLLGAPMGVGAVAGSRVSWERFSADGSLRFALQRWRPRSSFIGTIGDGLYPPVDQATPYPRTHDWIMDGSIASTRFRGTRAVTVEAGLAYAGLWQLSEQRANLYVRGSWGMF